MRYLRTNTATRITVGPFLDKTDGVTPETALTVTSCKLTLMVDTAGVPTLILDTAPTASGGANDMVHVTGDDAGFYDLELAAANVNYLGRAMLAITDAATHCPVFHEFMIVPAVVYDALFLGTDELDVTLANGAHGGSSMVLTFERMIGASTTTNEPAVKLTGNGTGAGLYSKGGASGSGMYIAGGVSNGYGIDIVSPTAYAINAGTAYFSAFYVFGATTFNGAVAATHASNDIRGVQADAVKISGSTDAADRLELSTESIVTCTASGVPTTTSIPTSACDPAGSALDQFKGRVIIFRSDTTTVALRGQATEITGSSASATPTFTVTALTTAPASGDTFVIV